MDRVPGGGGVRRRPPTGDPASGVLGQLRDMMRVEVRPPVPKQPSEKFIKVLVTHDAPKDKDKPSDELVGPEGVLEVLVVGIGPSYTRDDSSMAGQFTPAHNGMDGAVAPRSVPTMAEHFNRTYMRNAPKDKDHRSGESGDLESNLDSLVIGVAPTITYRSRSLDRKVMAAEGRKGSNHEKSKGFWSLDTLQSTWYGVKKKYYKCKNIYYNGKYFVESLGKGPGLYKDIGHEARCLLEDDFLDKNLKGRKTSSITMGMSFLDPQSVTKFLFNGRFLNTSLSLDGTQFTRADHAIINRAVSRVRFYDVLGSNSQAILNVPLPYINDPPTYINEKLEFRTMHRFSTFTGHISHGAPHGQVTLMLGNYLFAAGGLVQINTETNACDYSLGGTLRAQSFSAGLLMSKNEGVTSVEATLFKKLESELTSVGVFAIHSLGNQPWHQRTSLTVGAAQIFPRQGLILKGRISSRSGGVLLKKSICEKFSVVLSSEFDYNRVQNHLRQGVKFGILFSIP